ncbi:hypothetical protein [Streptomyces sp. NPDC001137]
MIESTDAKERAPLPPLRLRRDATRGYSQRPERVILAHRQK